MSAPNSYRRSMLAFALASATLIAGAGAYAAHDREAEKRGGSLAGTSAGAVKAEADLKALGLPEDRLASR